jgi:hypothetical protein
VLACSVVAGISEDAGKTPGSSGFSALAALLVLECL